MVVTTPVRELVDVFAVNIDDEDCGAALLPAGDECDLAAIGRERRLRDILGAIGDARQVSSVWAYNVDLSDAISVRRKGDEP